MIVRISKLIYNSNLSKIIQDKTNKIDEQELNKFKNYIQAFNYISSYSFTSLK